MESWPDLRAHYRREFAEARKRKENQTTVAKRGGLIGDDGRPGQNQISKILAYDDYTPQLDTFLKAVQGLGMTFLEFLTRMHQRLERTAVTGQGVRPHELLDDLALIVPGPEGLGPPISIGLKKLTEAVQQVVARERRG